eukprot:TRINITY_DN44941_c0_g1_i1.p3 TRINITY_DN44941_c0_g1~~TRINITY_DN44941_c0_g1_i1.p3  ORF type:complete len:106 (-),score=8.21 TRINITY_DN44941_c0_g1_i1:346-663(-)
MLLVWLSMPRQSIAVHKPKSVLRAAAVLTQHIGSSVGPLKRVAPSTEASCGEATCPVRVTGGTACCTQRQMRLISPRSDSRDGGSFTARRRSAPSGQGAFLTPEG